MKFFIKNTGENIVTVMRKIGYFFIGSSFIRPLGRSGFPRLHLYISKKNEELIFNLHLDQKRPIYKGALAHSGEYEGQIVENEAERIKQILK